MLTLEDARKLIAAAERKAEEIGQPADIAVDAGGNPCSVAAKSWAVSV